MYLSAELVVLYVGKNCLLGGGREGRLDHHHAEIPRVINSTEKLPVNL